MRVGRDDAQVRGDAEISPTQRVDARAESAALTELAPASLTVGVGTRNRPESLLRCVRSLAALGAVLAEVIVVDDGSDPPAHVAAAEGDAPLPPVRMIRHERSGGVAAARNEIAAAARTPWVLNLDDDAMVLNPEAVYAAIRVLEADAAVGAVAFAQTDEKGRPWPPQAQPSPVDYACYVPTFIGYAHLLRRDAFLRVGGFRAQLGINGEEKELSLRMLDAGFRTVYLPQARIGHVADVSGRDPRRYLMQTVRNTVLAAVYDEPLPLALASVPVRLLRYFKMRRGWRIHDPGGFRRVLGALLSEFPEAVRQRHPVRWSTIRAWRRLTHQPPEPYPARA